MDFSITSPYPWSQISYSKKRSSYLVRIDSLKYPFCNPFSHFLFLCSISYNISVVIIYQNEKKNNTSKNTFQGLLWIRSTLSILHGSQNHGSQNLASKVYLFILIWKKSMIYISCKINSWNSDSWIQSQK